MDHSSAFEVGTVLADAQRKEALTDWGPGEFERPLGVLLADYARAVSKADLNAVGVHILRSGLVHSLRMRLRAQEWVRRHPEILDERVAAPIVVVGMMRSGTTLLQRLLAADPRFHCAYGWEVVEVAPRLDHRFGGVDPRIAVSEAREAKSRELAPELFAIHPMYARQAEEEIVFLADAFLSHVPESGAHLPVYRSWLDEQDFAPAYDYLHRMLRFLQWQKRQAGSTARRWVLKSPAHLGYLDTLRAQFPDLHLVHMHRDPRTTIASGASLNATLHAMHADTVDRKRVGARVVAADGLDQRPGHGRPRRLGLRWRPGHRRLLRRRGGRPDRPGGPRLRRRRAGADRRGGGRDAALAGRTAPRGGAPAVRAGRLRPDDPNRSTSGSRCTPSDFEEYRGRVRNSG